MPDVLERDKMVYISHTAPTPAALCSAPFDYLRVDEDSTPILHRAYVVQLVVGDPFDQAQHPTGSEKVPLLLARLGVPAFWLAMSVGWAPFAVQDNLTPAHLVRSVAQPPVQRAMPATQQLATKSVLELREWLGFSWTDLARATGVHKNTLINYSQGRATPHADKLQRLLRVHALVRGAVVRLGAPAAVQWLIQGEPSVLQLITAGDIEQATRRVQGLLVEPDAVHHRSPGIEAEDAPLALPDFPTDSPPPLRVRRPHRKIHLAE